MGLLNGFNMVLRCELCFDTLEKQLGLSENVGLIFPMK